MFTVIDRESESWKSHVAECRKSLLDLIVKYGYKEDKNGFKLSSGGRSDYLIDLSQVLRRPDARESLKVLATEELRINDKDAWVHDTTSRRWTAVGGPSLGADPIAAVLADYYHASWFSVRKEDKNRGFDQDKITGPLSPGEEVLLVEDVLTTGSNLWKASMAVTSLQARISAILVVVDREENDAFVRMERLMACSGAGQKIMRLFTSSEIKTRASQV